MDEIEGAIEESLGELSGFSREIWKFSNDLLSLVEISNMIMSYVENEHQTTRQKTIKILQDLSLKTEILDEKKLTRYSIPIEKLEHISKYIQITNDTNTALEMLPGTLLMLLVSRMDELIGNLLRVIFEVQPNLLKSRAEGLQITPEQLLTEALDLDELKNRMVEKEIDRVVRESHTYHFKYIEELLNIKLRVELDVWPIYIEATERRNLFAHVGGRVSRQYLNVCSQNGIDVGSTIKVGDTLKINGEYFGKVIEAFIEIGTKLGLVVWRNLIPDDSEKSHASYSELCYLLIKKSYYPFAAKMLEFAFTPKMQQDVTEYNKLKYVINSAQACKWMGDMAECERILALHDWSAAGVVFNLAIHVLRDEFEEAAKLMAPIKDLGSPPSYAYREWPLFQKFRETDVFKATYANLYGRGFEVSI